MGRFFQISAVAFTCAASFQSALGDEARLSALVSQMTLEEKLGQMSQWSVDLSEPGILEKLTAAARAGRIGSTLNINDAAAMNAVQKAARESRLGVPLINGQDVIHGYRTQFPIPLGQAATWNPELVREAAAAAAREAKSKGVHWTFSPMIDIARDPRWGRIAESGGEDPYLTSAMGVAMVQGYQGENFAACAKHFAGYGAAEAGRDYNTTLIPETELRNVYLKPFHAVQKAGVMTFMSAFNDLNGTPATANTFLMRQVLRKEWGFNGFVVSDWESVMELTRHGIAADLRDAARLGITAGVDLEMVSTAYLDHGVELVKSGAISEELINDSVRSILRVKERLGLLDQPFTDDKGDSALLLPETLALARRAATESLVLLKNKGARLPLEEKLPKVAVVGPLADSHADMLGCWSCVGKPEDTVTVLDGVRALLGNDRVLHASGTPSDVSLDKSGFAAAVEAANNADVVIACVGEGALLNGEARSRAFLNLPGAQEDLVDALAATGKPLVLVVFSGRPLVLARPEPKADAILFVWHPGTMAGPAIADVLFGRETPGGKITATFPRAVGQIPIYYNARNTGRPSTTENVGETLGTAEHPVGYSSRHLDVHSAPAYPFGFGLSYTTFGYSDLVIGQPDAGGTRQISVRLTNTGKRAGSEVAQLYIQDAVASLTRPVRELKGFKKVTLQPGESTNVTFALPREELGFYDQQSRFVVEPGVFRVWVGGDSTASLSGEFVLLGQSGL
ncbi:MAG: glycoside hydrolase family 3 N-terminal domain-containing protein [Opitutaceae bacterium]|nr:glycoside hydrolase family 3 N-terminal domain-containing protein [Opitutaceae bacterium]